MTVRHLSLFLASLFSASIALAANPPKPAVSDIAAGLLSIKIDGMQDLPISGLKMVKSGEQTVFISSNGRFAFYGGKLMDIWTQQEIKELADIDNIANRIDLSRMKLKADDLGAVTVGHGKGQVLVFIDPRCPYCAQLMKELQTLQDQYTFKLVMIPILGPESQNLVVQLACQWGSSETKVKEAVRDRLLKQDYAGLPTEPPTQCNKEPLQKAVVTAKLFDLKGVPFLIAPDGRTHSGAPEGLADWLADKPKASPSLATTPATNAPIANAPGETALKPMHSRSLTLISAWLMVLTSGCATTEYGCKGMPDEPSCLSTTQAYQITNTAITEAPPVNTQISESMSSPTLAPPLQQPVPKIDDPTPIRTPSQVMRIWIAPWEDVDGDLMVSNYVYTELEPRRWMIGKAAPTASASLIPLQVEQRPPEKRANVDTADDEAPVNRVGKPLP